MSTGTILNNNFAGTSFDDETPTPAGYYQIAVANVRGNPVWTNSSVPGDRSRFDPYSPPDPGTDPEVEVTPSVLNFKAEMVNTTTIRLSWDKPPLTYDATGTIDPDLYKVKAIRFSTDENEWTTLSQEEIEVSSPREAVMLDGTIRMTASVKYRLILPNVPHYVQIATFGNSGWSDSDAIWWLDSYKWLSHRWSESNIERNETPLFLAHIYRVRSASEIAILIAMRTKHFLDDAAQELLADALAEYNYQTDIFDTVVVDALGEQTIPAYSLSDGKTTTSAAYAVLDVLSADDLFVYPDPANDIISVEWSLEQAAGGFNKRPTALVGFESVPVPANLCLLEHPFTDRFSIGYDARGYNFHLEPVRQSVGGTMVHPFAFSGSFIFKVVLTPVVGNPIVLTYDVVVSV